MSIPIRVLAISALLLCLGFLGNAYIQSRPTARILRQLETLEKHASFSSPPSIVQAARRADAISNCFTQKVDLDSHPRFIRIQTREELRQMAFSAIQQCDRISVQFKGENVRVDDSAAGVAEVGCTLRGSARSGGQEEVETSEVLITFAMEEGAWKIAKIQQIHPFDRPDIGIRQKEVDR